MPKTDGDITRQRILEVAEDLFASKGYDAASMDAIARSAGINKATIYYHFKDKNDIIISLFGKIISELETRINSEINSAEDLKVKLKKEIAYLRSKRKILTILVMEQLKSNENNSFFQIGKSVIDAELKEKKNTMSQIDLKSLQKYYVHDFFTGLLPLIMYVIFEESWAAFFGYQTDSLVDDFIEQFEISHLKTHL